MLPLGGRVGERTGAAALLKMVKLNKIYTRTGDDGTTGLVDGSRLPKSDLRMAAIGDVDELNSAIGVAIAALAGEYPARLLETIQNDLFDLGADFATPGEDFTPGEMTLRIVPAQTARLELAIDAANESLTPLTSFILPGGTPAAAALHLARAIARRAERSAVAATQAAALNPEALRYLNRLSDLLFVFAREMNLSAGGDVLWQPGASR
jgi:cob(I)alamin adenosyltransferase